MNDSAYDIISLDQCNELFYALDVPRDSKQYWRWHTERGFRYVDIDDVLGDSPLLLGQDWRGDNRELYQSIPRQLERMGIELMLNKIEGQSFVEISSLGRSTNCPTQDDTLEDLSKLISAINELIKIHARYIAFANNEGADTHFYALFSNDAWAEFLKNAPDLAHRYFRNF